MADHLSLVAEQAHSRINPASVKRSMLLTFIILIVSVWLGVLLSALAFLFGSVLTIVGIIPALALLVAEGGVIALIGLVIIPIGATLAGWLSVYFASRMARSMFALAPPTPDDALGARVIELSNRLGITPPAAMWEENVMNAFAMGGGSDASLVVIGRPLAQILTPEELDAIIGHELGHVVTNDCVHSSFGRAFQQWLSWFFVFNGMQTFARRVLTPLGEAFLMFRSRQREYWADAIGAALTSKEAMIGALEKLNATTEPLTKIEKQHAALMFRGLMSGLIFHTHPTFQQRVTALENESRLSRIRFIDYDLMPSAFSEEPNARTDYSAGI